MFSAHHRDRQAQTAHDARAVPRAAPDPTGLPRRAQLRQSLCLRARQNEQHGGLAGRDVPGHPHRFGLPAQLACSVPRQVGATDKTLWTKVKANAAARNAGHTKQRDKGLDQPPKYVAPTLTYQLGHDYGCTTAQQVSILSLQGRVLVPYTGYAKHVARIQPGAQIGAAKRWYDKPHQQFYLLVSLEVEVADP